MAETEPMGAQAWRAGIALLERHDNFAPVRNAIRKISAGTAEYAGIPIPVDGEELVIEKSYPWAHIVGNKHADPSEYIERNSFWSTRYRMTIHICEKDGKIVTFVTPGANSIGLQLQTLGASYAWGIEQEHKAIVLLGTLVRHNAFKHYLLTGIFLESSKRSGVTYVFRKLRPTLALSMRSGSPKTLCAMCMHPIGYYADSWGGAMCPTDDVIAHLMLMRADEKMFWRRCNQHASYRPEAGV